MTYKSVPGSAIPFRWMPPEALEKRRFSEASDVWSFGVTAWELLTDGKLPYAFIQGDEEVAQRVCSGQRPPRPISGCPDGLWRIVEACWAQNPKGRPRFSSLASELGHLQSPVVIPRTRRPSSPRFLPGARGM